MGMTAILFNKRTQKALIRSPEWHCLQLQETKPQPVAAMFFDEYWQLEQSWKRVTKGTFLPSYTVIVPVVSDKKMFKVFYIDI